jgi:predicted GTPase
MADTYLEIREQLELAILELASTEGELGTAEEAVEPIKSLAEGLHSPFCLVVLGEKLSGKSTLLNAYIREDLVPLGFDEDKIRVFRYGTKLSDRLVADDLEECARPLPFLRNFTLIDTPANLLLGDARSLTRDIFPIADLVLCVFSVENPWAPSTWEFLRNVKKEWLSKVVFVITQTDLRSKEEADLVSASLVAHAEECIGAKPVFFEVSAQDATKDPEARKSSGIEELEEFISQRSAANHAHIQKARSISRAARGPLIDIAERVRGTLYLASVERKKIEDLVQVLDEAKQAARQEVRELVQTVNDCYNKSQAEGEVQLKAKLTLLQTLKSAFARSNWQLSFQEEAEREVRSLITKTTESVKANLLAGSQRFLENCSFSREEEQQAISVALGSHGKQLSDQIKKTLARNRTEGIEDTMNDILDAAGAAIRKPALVSLVCLLLMGVASFFNPMYMGLAAVAASLSLAVTLMVVVQKHDTIFKEYKLHISQKRERVINTIDRQINEAIDAFCEKHKLLVPSSTFADSAQTRLAPFVPKVKELEERFSAIESKLDTLLAEPQ